VHWSRTLTPLPLLRVQSRVDPPHLEPRHKAFTFPFSLKTARNHCIYKMSQPAGAPVSVQTIDLTPHVSKTLKRATNSDQSIVQLANAARPFWNLWREDVDCTIEATDENGCQWRSRMLPCSSSANGVRRFWQELFIVELELVSLPDSSPSHGTVAAATKPKSVRELLGLQLIKPKQLTRAMHELTRKAYTHAPSSRTIADVEDAARVSEQMEADAQAKREKAIADARDALLWFCHFNGLQRIDRTAAEEAAATGAATAATAATTAAAATAAAAAATPPTSATTASTSAAVAAAATAEGGRAAREPASPPAAAAAAATAEGGRAAREPASPPAAAATAATLEEGRAAIERASPPAAAAAGRTSGLVSDKLVGVHVLLHVSHAYYDTMHTCQFECACSLIPRSGLSG
jgi:hypothetical protein